MTATTAPVSQPPWIVTTYSRRHRREWDHDGWAELALDVQRAQELEELLEQVVGSDPSDYVGKFKKAVFQLEQAPLTWHRYPGSTDPASVDERFKEARRASLDGGAAIEVEGDTNLPRHKRNAGQHQLLVYEEGLEWTMFSGESQFKTGLLKRHDLARVQLYAGNPQEVRKAFKTLSRVAPHQAIEVLEEGIHPHLPVEGAKPQRSIAGLLRKEDLSYLLQSKHAPDREQALVALARVNNSTEQEPVRDEGRQR